MLGIENDYDAYCLDEACAYIEEQLKQGKQLHYRKKVKSMQEYLKDMMGDG